MLIEFYGRNFGCFRDEFRLSMLATHLDRRSNRGIVKVNIEGDDEPLTLLRCAAIFGPNASGKSTVLRAASALNYLIRKSDAFESDQRIEPYEPFLLDGGSRDKPVMLGLRAVIEHQVYEYTIEFDRNRFVSETLKEIRADDDHLLFKRDSDTVTGPWKENELFSLLSRSLRPNALLLTLADRIAPDLAHGLAVGFSRLLQFFDPSKSFPSIFGTPGEAAARRSFRDKRFGQWMLSWLRIADLGIVDSDVQEVELQEMNDAELDKPPGNRRKHVDYMLTFTHGGEHAPHRIPYPRESMGTRKLVGVAPFIHDLEHGKPDKVFFIDEMGASLHPQMLEAIIRRFNCEVPEESVRGQLVFDLHETSLIDGEARDAVLRRDQVWFTEKDLTGASKLYSLAEFKERDVNNMRRRYLQGRYGALPAIGILEE